MPGRRDEEEKTHRQREGKRERKWRIAATWSVADKTIVVSSCQSGQREEGGGGRR